MIEPETECLDNAVAEAPYRTKEETVAAAGGYSQRRGGGGKERGRERVRSLDAQVKLKTQAFESHLVAGAR